MASESKTSTPAVASAALPTQRVQLPADVRVQSIPEQRSVNGRAFPLTLAPAGRGSFTELTALVKEHREAILTAALTHGAVLLRGFSGWTAEGFAGVAEALNLKKFPYIGGAAPRTNVVRDVVFTTNESPPSEPIPFHHEMAQVPTPPSYVMFYCETAPKAGGETPIILSEEVCKFFFKNSPEFAAKVEELGVKYVRVMPEEDDNTSAIGRSWKSTFGCSSKEEAEAKMTEMGTTWEWLANGDLRTVTATVPALRTDPRTGRKMFFNSMVAAFTGWVDSRNDPSKAVLLGDGSAVDGEALLAVAKFMKRNRVAFKWKAGDVIIIDNTVAMHSRNTFERPRRILAALGGPSLDGFATGDTLLPAETPKAAAGDIPTKTLSRTGDNMPAVGVGFWKVPRELTADTVVASIKAGIYHLDCACDYGNEKEVGEGIARAIAEGLVTREQLWVTSKLWNTFHSAEDVELGCRKSLADLGLDYLDLYLIHFPIPLRFVPIETRYPPEWVHDPEDEEPRMEMASVPVHVTWPAMEALVDQGLVRNIGVCNFPTALLRDLLCYARYSPQVLQVELHPYNSQRKLTRMAMAHGITITAFSPLGAGSYVSIGLGEAHESALKDEAVVAIAAAHGKSPAQVILRWAVQLGRSVVFKTTKEERLVENTSLFDFELSEDDMAAINKLNTGRRFNDPGFFCEGMNTFCPIYE